MRSFSIKSRNPLHNNAEREKKKMLEKFFGNKKAVADIILIAALLILALSSFFIIELLREDGAFVRVSIGGEIVAEYSLSKDGEYSLNGGSNILNVLQCCMPTSSLG